jgi:methanogenic corrinoid protein MtbC1
VSEIRIAVVGVGHIGLTLAENLACRVRDQVKVIIGGAPVTQAFADQVGADGHAEGAGGASWMAKALLDVK